MHLFFINQYVCGINLKAISLGYAHGYHTKLLYLLALINMWLSHKIALFTGLTCGYHTKLLYLLALTCGQLGLNYDGYFV